MTKRFIIAILAVVAMVLVSCTHTETTYYPDGRTQSIIQYRGKKEHGKTVYFYRNPNTVEIEVEMKNGKRNGEFRRYFINGLLDTYCVYKNDSIEGVEVMYMANGCKSQETTYLHGHRNGPHKAYHIDGSLKLEGGFKNDLFEGPWTYYDERGVLVGEGEFHDGTGQVTFYDKNGLPKLVSHYKNNKKDGKELYYTPSGSVYREIVFKEDRIVSDQTDSTLLK
jgi:antitoxin component YwqK of YwqJK toxin-antitoxin module